MSINLTDIISLKAHFSFHVSIGTSAYIFSEQETLLLNGQVYSVIIPIIAKAGKTVEQIILETADIIQPELTLYALELLNNNNLIAYNQSNNNAQDAFWSLNNATSSDANNDIASKKIEIISYDLPENYVKTLTTILSDSGFDLKSSKPADISLLLCNDYLNSSLDNKIKELSATQQKWLVIKPTGNDIWFGPLSTNNDVCWDCVTTRLLENRLGQHVLSDDPRASSIPPLATMDAQINCALNLAVSFLIRHITLKQDTDLSKHIHVLSVEALEINKHFLLPDPGCIQMDHAIHKSNNTNSEQDTFTQIENCYRATSTVDTYSKIEQLVSPLTGLIPQLCRSDQYNSSYIYYARHGFNSNQKLSGNRISGKPSWACGKGTTDIDARVSCIAEAIERYSAGYFGNEKTLKGTLKDIDGAIHPNEVLLFSEDQYNNRESKNSSINEFDWIPERFNPENSIEWVEYQSINGKQNILLPAKLSYLNYQDANSNNFCRADSNGCATGNTLDEAILFALFELIERDSVAIWWFNCLSSPRVDTASFNDHSINRIIESLEHEKRKVITIDITSNLGIYTFVSISWTLQKHNEIYIGYGTHLDPLIAVKRSLNEVMQIASYHKENPSVNNAALRKWLYDTTLNELPFLEGNKNEIKNSTDYINLSTHNIISDIEQCTDRLTAKNINAYALNLTRDDSLLPTARVITPGLRHFWPRLAEGRLYDVPVEMEPLSEKNSEHSINQYYYPL